MALRRIVVSLGFLAVFAGAALLVWRPSSKIGTVMRSSPDRVLPVRSFSFRYASHSYLNPALPGTAGPGLTIACESTGLMHLMTPDGGDLTFIFEFTNVLCAGADVIAERGLLRTVRFTRQFLASPAAVERATEDPALAIARSLFLQIDGGLRTNWPESGETLINRERRLEGEVQAALRFTRDEGTIHWTKHFSGPVPGEPAAAGLKQSLRYHVNAKSLLAVPIEMGLLELQGTEQSLSLQKKQVLARTDIEIEVRITASLDAALAQSILAETKADAPSAAPRLMTIEEKQQLIVRWRHFRDGEGQKPAFGESEANQEAYLELKRALRHDPGLAQDLAEDLNDLDPGSSAFATLAGAFIYSGEEQALDVFVTETLVRKDQMEWQERALPMIGLAPKPSLQSWKYLDTMRQLSKEPALAGAAELGMATHLKRGYQGRDFVIEIHQRLEAAQTEAERLHLLDLVGNAGLQQFLPIISSWLPGSSIPLRLRIAQALRFMNLAEAEALLLQMAADPHPETALMALQCLRDRTVSVGSIPTLLGLLSSAHDERIRLKVLENLYEARRLDAELLQKISRIRQGFQLSVSLAEAWDQIEKDWLDPVET